MKVQHSELTQTEYANADLPLQQWRYSKIFLCLTVNGNIVLGVFYTYRQIDQPQRTTTWQAQLRIPTSRWISIKRALLLESIHEINCAHFTSLSSGNLTSILTVSITRPREMSYLVWRASFFRSQGNAQIFAQELQIAISMKSSSTWIWYLKCINCNHCSAVLNV